MNASAVSIVRSWTEGGITGQERRCFLVRITLTADGGTVGDIPATAFGLTAVEECSFGVDSSSQGQPFVPTYARDGIVALNPTDLGQLNDATGTFQLTVKGY